MGKQQRRQRMRESPPGRGRRLAERLRWPVSVLVVAMVAAASGLWKLYMLVVSLRSGVYTSVSRVGGPSRVYSLDADPRDDWLWMAWDGLFAVLLLLMGVAVAWLLLALRKPQ